MPDTPDLHDLTAELHAAVNHPQRWRAAWLALNEFMGQATQAGDVPPVSPAPDSTRPGWCGPGNNRRCNLASDSQLRHCDPANAPAIPELGDGFHGMTCYLQATYLAAMDALPLATWLCDENRHMLHANVAGLAELKRQRWFKLDAGQLCACDRVLQPRLVASFANLVADEARDGTPAQAAVQLEFGPVEVGLRRVAQSERPHLVLVSVASGAHHGVAAPQDVKMAYWPERRLLSPRQRELAGLLLTFHSLDDAADKMGITRRTARDHLAGLFQATGMRRQQDLINFLRHGRLP